MTNQTLRKARAGKKDEFYTQYTDIAKELVHYKKQLRGKTVYCNCDDPNKSNFVKYFTDNFNSLGLKRLIATHYIPQTTDTKPTKLILTQANNAEGFISTFSVLSGNGDFRSEECVVLLKEADIVVTNPPFSLWREFVELILAKKKQFIAMGTTQAINYQSVLGGVRQGKISTGYTNYNKTLKFIVPEHYNGRTIADTTTTTKYAEVPAICWWTNLPITNREPIQLHKRYTPDDYPNYEAKNTKGKPVASAPYDAINVDRVADIPCDYYGLMGVPITVLGKIDNSQFEIIDVINNCYIGDRKVYARLIIKRKKATVSAIKEELDKIYNWDCIQGMRCLPAKSVDMVLTDIPYGEVNRKSGSLCNLDKGIADIVTFDLEVLCAEISRVCKGTAYIFCGIKQISELTKLLQQHGFSTRLGQWEKTNPNPMNGKHIWLSGSEFCVIGRKQKATFNRHCEKPIWRYPVGRNKLHTTQKPVPLFEYLIESSTNEGDLVLDCCMGSGTTAIAALNTKRHYIGFELDRGYYDIACKRVHDHNATQLKSEDSPEVGL